MTDLSYPALLTLHLLAIVIFLGGLFLNAVALPGMGSISAGELKRARKVNTLVVTPALALVWLFGLSLASKGGWFAATWLHAKIALVVLLSILHGLLSARLRRLGTPMARPISYLPLLAAMVLVIGIVVLVTSKPG